jgi:hypothetical protein
MTAINFVTRRFFGTNSAAEAAGEEFSGGPAHYTHTETQKWWHEILDEWQVTPVSDFAAQLLANGTTGRAVDVNDVVAVREFGDLAADVSFIYNGGSALNEIQLLTVANQPGEQIGFQLFWPYWDSAYQRGRDVFYGISRWNPRHQEWDTLVDENMISSRSQLAVNQEGVEFQRVEVRYPAKQSGTYKITVMNAGDSSRITSLDYNFKTGEYSGARPYSYLGRPMGHTQSPVYFYIPKGTKSLDMEVYDTYNNKKLQLYSGLPATGQKPTRVIDVSKRGTHTLKLEAGEDGTIAELRSDGFAFPFLYSVPMLWAKSPATLIVPRAIAQADGLTIIE